jgi:hypothetical protein
MALEFLALGRRENQTLGKGVQISMGAQALQTALGDMHRWRHGLPKRDFRTMRYRTNKKMLEPRRGG